MDNLLEGFEPEVTDSDRDAEEYFLEDELTSSQEESGLSDANCSDEKFSPEEIIEMYLPRRKPMPVLTTTCYSSEQPGLLSGPRKSEQGGIYHYPTYF